MEFSYNRGVAIVGNKASKYVLIFDCHRGSTSKIATALNLCYMLLLYVLIILVNLVLKTSLLVVNYDNYTQAVYIQFYILLIPYQANKCSFSHSMRLNASTG